MTTVELIKKVFVAGGFQFISHKPRGRLLFYYSEEDRDVQFWYKPDKDSLERAMKLICEICYQRGKRTGVNDIQFKIKELLNIDTP